MNQSSEFDHSAKGGTSRINSARNVGFSMALTAGEDQTLVANNPLVDPDLNQNSVHDSREPINV